MTRPHAAFSAADISAATALLGRILTQIYGATSYLVSFASCLLGGRWSLAALDTRIDFGDGTIAIPYGVKVCVTRNCATQFSATQIATELGRSWESLFSVLAALYPHFVTALLPLGIALTPPSALGLPPLLAAAGPVVVACAAVILGLMIIALVWGTAIISQMTVWHTAGLLDSNGDGYVCIEHPTFALALLEAALLSVAPAELVPPIVNPI